MAKVGSIVISLGLDQAKFQQGVKSARNSASRFSKDVQKQFRAVRRTVNDVGKSFTRMAGVVAAIAGPAALGALVKSSMANVDAQQKLASRLGLTQEALAGLTLAASETAGVSQNTLGMALQRMTRRTAEAAQGIGEARGAIKELGLDAGKLAAMSPDQQFRAISEAMQGVASQGDALRLSFKLFDSEGAALVSTLREGPEALAEYEQAARDLGLSLDRIDTAKIERANDAIGRSKLAFQGLGNTIAVEVSPFLTRLANDFTSAAREAKGFGNETEIGMNKIITAAGTVANVMRGIEAAFLGAKLLAQGFGAAIINSLALAATMAAKAIDTINAMVNVAIDGLNRLPNVNIARLASVEASSVIQTIQGVAEESRKAVAKTRGELHELAMQPMPLDEFRKWANGVREETRQLSEDVNLQEIIIPQIQKKTMGGGSSSGEEKGSEDKAGSIKNLIASSITDGARTGVDGMVDTFRDGLMRMAQEMLQSRILGMLSNLGAGMGGGGGLLASFGGLLGFANGGSFKVGGGGGTDSQLVAFRASPNETVDVRRPDQQAGGAVHVSVNIDARGSDSAGSEARLRQIAQQEIVPQAIRGATDNVFRKLNRPRFA